MSTIVGDFFDSLLNSSCWILAKGAGVKDAYRQESQQYTALAHNVPCCISTKALGRPKEFKAEKESSLNFKTVMMRPPTLTGGVALNPHHWLAFNVTVNPSGNVKIDGTQYSADLRNIFQVDDPHGLGHHLEVIVEKVIG